MIFNFWRRYPRRKPKGAGYYLCTIDNGLSRWVTVLYFDGRYTWIDRSRQKVFDGYQVYKVCRVPNEENRVWTDGLCEPENVVAWKRLPKGYMEKR